jgi:LysM repeat protein
MRYLSLLLLCIFSGMSLQAQVVSSDEHDQKFVHYIDSAGLVIIEVVEPGMTFYHLKTRYNISVDSLYRANPDLDPSFIPLGYPIQIPVNPVAISFTPPVDGQDSIPIFYRVQPKETLYRISKVYLGVSPEELIRLNPRIEEGLSIGQVIHIGWYNPGQYISKEPMPAFKDTLTDTLSVFRITDFETNYLTAGKTIQEQKGLAVWKPGSNQAHYYVLHPTALVGSYVEITNPMLHRTLTAKVAGNLVSGLYPPQVGIVVSPSVARALGVLDQQFFASWRFVE